MKAQWILVVLLVTSTALASTKSLERRAIRAAQRVSVRALDPGLPDKPFATWFRSIVGKQTAIEWEVNDCGEQSGSPGDDPESVPMCAQATAHVDAQRTVVVSISIGTFSEGVRGRPALFWATVTKDDRNRDTIRLSALPEMLRE